MVPNTDIRSGFCECGCGRETKIAAYDHSLSGDIAGQPRRFIKGHNGRKVAYRIDAGSGCWIWQLSVDRQGYPASIRKDGRSGTPWRHLYKLHYGDVPNGYELHHRCENRLCVNPDHLEAVSTEEHRHRHGRAVVTPELRERIRRLASAGKSRRVIGAEVGVSGGYVGRLVNQMRDDGLL